jgi:hypothetical protein
VEGGAVVREREVQVALAQPPVVVLAVDQVVALGAVLVRGEVQEVADAVGFFADVVAVRARQMKSASEFGGREDRGNGQDGDHILLPPQLIHMPPRKGDRLRARKTVGVAPEQIGHLGAQLPKQVA